jgi:hypothetical protein
VADPAISAAKVREAILALEGTVIEDLAIPLPGDLRDIAKAAALVSGVVEDRIPELLNRVRAQTWDEDGEFHAYEFRRMTIGFPDIQLVERSNPGHFIFELEAKSWYILATDALTARYETSADAVRPGTLIAIVAWILDGIVSGRPKLLRIYVDDAQRLANGRDDAWTRIDPLGSHRVTQPENPAATPRSLLKTQAIAEMLDANGSWRPESENFGKLERLYDPDIQTFRDTTLELIAAGKTLGNWRSFITTNPAQVANKAVKAVKAAKKAAG